MTSPNPKMPILFIPHGGGPLPLLDDINHQGLIAFLQQVEQRTLTPIAAKPKALLVISAHFETPIATVSSAEHPTMMYDYYGFPEQSYQIQYPAAGEPQLAAHIVSLLKRHDIPATTDAQRGFDHGTFVPLKLIYPKADIPVVQLSLINHLDAQSHINLGIAIAELAQQGVLIIGSGLSFHNLPAMMNEQDDLSEKSQAFDLWLNQTVLDKDLSSQHKLNQLANWHKAPHARFAHPREEHLLPLLVCMGAAMKANYQPSNIFNQPLMGAKTSGFMWSIV